MRVVRLLCVLFSAVLLGCGSPVPATKAHAKKTSKTKAAVASQTAKSAPSKPIAAGPTGEKNSFQPFYIFSDKGSRQNHYIPSGFMPNGNCLSLDEAWAQNCHSGKNCVKIEYDVRCSRKDQRWAGIYWLNPANNWGQRKGGFNLTGAQRLTFWARGEKGGEQIQEFTVGGISGNYPDSDIMVMGPAILSPQWQQYTIDLRGKDLSYISGGFAFSTNEEVNLQDSCTFYLDEVRFE